MRGASEESGAQQAGRQTASYGNWGVCVLAAPGDTQLLVGGRSCSDLGGQTWQKAQWIVPASVRGRRNMGSVRELVPANGLAIAKI